MLTRLALTKTKQGLALVRLFISNNQLHGSQSNTLAEIMTKTKITKRTLVYNVMKELYAFTSIFWKMCVFLGSSKFKHYDIILFYVPKA